jgi:hypothetical protein
MTPGCQRQLEKVGPLFQAQLARPRLMSQQLISSDACLGATGCKLTLNREFEKSVAEEPATAQQASGARRIDTGCLHKAKHVRTDHFTCMLDNSRMSLLQLDRR